MVTVGKVKRGSIVASLLSIVLIASLAAPAGAHKTASTERKRKERIENQIRTLRQEVEEASAAEAQLLKRLEAVERRHHELDARVADLDARIGPLQAELDAASFRLRQVESQLSSAEAKLRLTEQQLSDAKDELRERAVAAYLRQPSAQAAELVLNVRSVRDIVATKGYLSAVVQTQARAVDRHERLRDDVDDQRRALEVTRADAQIQRDDVARRHDDLVLMRKEQDRARQQAMAEERRQEELIGEARSRKAEFEDQIQALKAESDSIAAFLRSAQRGQGVTVSGKGLLAMPIAGGRITSGFGPRVHPILGTVRIHTGVDISGRTGTAIRSAADGVVVYSGWRGGYGLCTIIDHGGSVATLYAHQNRLGVGEGQRVSKGQVIGSVGSTGFSTGPHLHFEVRVAGTPVNPVPYL